MRDRLEIEPYLGESIKTGMEGPYEESSSPVPSPFGSDRSSKVSPCATNSNRDAGARLS